MSAPFSIRRLGAEDAAGYRAIRLEALQDAPFAFGSDFTSAARLPARYFRDVLERLAVFGAFDAEQRQVGLIAFARLEGEKYCHRGEMVSVFVRREARGTGCGQQLVGTVIAHARGAVVQVHCMVATDNMAAIGLYRRMGFAVYGTEPRSLLVDGRFIDEHLMVRFLDRD